MLLAAGCAEDPGERDSSDRDQGAYERVESKALADDAKVPPVEFVECMASYRSRYPATEADDQQRRMHCRIVAEVSTLAASKYRSAYLTCLGTDRTLRRRYACGLRTISGQELCEAFADGHASCASQAAFRTCIVQGVRNRLGQSNNLTNAVPLYRNQRNRWITACSAKPTTATLVKSASFWRQGTKDQRFSLPAAEPALTPNQPATLIIRMQEQAGKVLPRPVAIATHRKTKRVEVFKFAYNSTKKWWSINLPADMMSKGLFLVTQIGQELRRNHPTFADNDIPSCEPPQVCPAPAEKISQIWVAQTHVQPVLFPVSAFGPSSPEAQLGFGRPTPWVRLVGGRDALVKIDAFAERGGLPVFMAAILKDGQQEPEEVVVFDRAEVYPTAALPSALGQDVHSHLNSFRAVIPGKYIDRGYRMRIVTSAYTGQDLATLPTTAGERSAEFDFGYVDPTLSQSGQTIHIAAPTPLPVNIFEFRFPSPTHDPRVLPNLAQFGAQLPAKVQMQRIVAPTFTRIAMDIGAREPDVRILGEEPQTGDHDGEVAFLNDLVSALQYAAGQQSRAIYASVAYDGDHLFGKSPNGYGTTNGFRASSTYPGYGEGVVVHEWTHALNASHPTDDSRYTFRNSMVGIYGTGAHMGPVWAYLPPGLGQTGAEAKLGTFVDPVKNRGLAGQAFRHTPLTVGHDDRLPNFFMSHYSILETRVMQANLERDQIVWGRGPGGDFWHHWNDVENTYGLGVNGGSRFVGRDVPRERAEEAVVSVLFSAFQPSTGGAGTHLIYPPIGPYRSTRIDLLNPALGTPDATKVAPSAYCDATMGDKKTDACDYTLRVTRGAGASPELYMVRAATRAWSYGVLRDRLTHAALNLPAEPPITKLELLYTPKVEDVGLPRPLPVPKATWSRP